MAAWKLELLNLHASLERIGIRCRSTFPVIAFLIQPDANIFHKVKVAFKLIIIMKYACKWLLSLEYERFCTVSI
jgi:hypothetical protein